MKKFKQTTFLVAALLLGSGIAKAKESILLTEKQMDKVVAGVVSQDPRSLFSGGNIAAAAFSSSNVYAFKRPTNIVVIAENSYSTTIGLERNGFNNRISFRIIR